ncbi:MAG TPA: hypothetical protein VLF90_01480 [Patescibacteria group bacterium]|nr:hypothetical protein [Patescibacteria group bacterium]
MAFIERTQKLKKLILATLMALILLIVPAHVLASTYGSGGYSNCAYSTGCASSGSGSTPSSTTPAATQPTEILLNDFSDYFTSSGVQLDLSVGQSVGLDMITDGISHHYTITVSAIGDTYVDLTFSTVSLNGRTNVGETKEYDLNGDGKNDISITLNSIANGKANFTFKTVLGASTTTQPKNTTAAPASKPKGHSWLWLTFSIVAIVVALIIFFILWWRRRKRNQQPGPWGPPSN